jgi:glucokinase
MTERNLIAGVDLGGTKIYSLVATPDGEVLGHDRRLTLAADGPEAVVERIAESVREALSGAGSSMAEIAGVGISSPGPCDPARGLVTDAPNLPGFHNIPLTQMVSEALGVAAILENDANAAAYGEYRFGAGKGFRHLLYVTLGTGIGGGIIVDGKVYEGASGAAGEVGHLVLIEDGPPCNCGGRGCLEALSSGPAMARDAAEALAAGRARGLARLTGGNSPTTEQVYAAAQAGDADCREIVERAGRHLGYGLVGLLNVFNPQALVLGGGLTNLREMYLEPAIEIARNGAFPQVVRDVTIAIAALGDAAGALGAAALVPDYPAR